MELKPSIRGWKLTIRDFKLLTRGWKLTTKGIKTYNLGIKLTIRGLKLTIRRLQIRENCLFWVKMYRKGEKAENYWLKRKILLQGETSLLRGKKP